MDYGKDEEGSEWSHYAFSYSIFLQLILRVGVVYCLVHYSI